LNCLIPWVSENAAHVKSFEPCLTGVEFKILLTVRSILLNFTVHILWMRPC